MERKEIEIYISFRKQLVLGASGHFETGAPWNPTPKTI